MTPALRGEGFDASEGGTGSGTPIVPAAYRTTGNDGAYATGDVTGALSTGTDPNAHVIAFSSKDHGADAMTDLSPTLRAGGHSGSHANAGVPPPVAFAENQRGELRTSDTVPALGQGGGKPGQGFPAALVDWQVRRLMPVECARLQGFADDHTAITYRGKPAADGPQYKAYGNSMAVPCVAWILDRMRISMEVA